VEGEVTFRETAKVEEVTRDQEGKEVEAHLVHTVLTQTDLEEGQDVIRKRNLTGEEGHHHQGAQDHQGRRAEEEEDHTHQLVRRVCLLHQNERRKQRPKRTLAMQRQALRTATWSTLDKLIQIKLLMHSVVEPARIHF
jgi:hypothetical protein